MTLHSVLPNFWSLQHSSVIHCICYFTYYAINMTIEVTKEETAFMALKAKTHFTSPLQVGVFWCPYMQTSRFKNCTIHRPTNTCKSKKHIRQWNSIALILSCSSKNERTLFGVQGSGLRWCATSPFVLSAVCAVNFSFADVFNEWATAPRTGTRSTHSNTRVTLSFKDSCNEGQNPALCTHCLGCKHMQKW